MKFEKFQIPTISTLMYKNKQANNLQKSQQTIRLHNKDFPFTQFFPFCLSRLLMNSWFLYVQHEVFIREKTTLYSKTQYIITLLPNIYSSAFHTQYTTSLLLRLSHT